VLVITNAVQRLFRPEQIQANGMVWMALLGAGMNLAAAWFTHGGRSLNEKAVNLHMLEDVLGWIVVLVGAVLIRLTNWVWIDPVMSLGVACFILWHAIGGMKQVMDVFLEKAPSEVEPLELVAHLQNIPRVTDVHHLHIWSMDGVRHFATVHVAAVPCDREALKKAIRQEFSGHGIGHVTIELEEAGERCEQKKCRQEQVCSRGHSHGHHGHHH
jgi:cobalt-zinc-cadmium efflux system protein